MVTVSDRWSTRVITPDRNASDPCIIEMPFESSSKKEALQVLGNTMADELFRLTGNRGGQGF
jgi:hypothetical protein